MWLFQLNMDGSNEKSYGTIDSISDLQPCSEVTIKIQDADLCIYTDNVTTDIQAVVEQLWLCVGQLGLDNCGCTDLHVKISNWVTKGSVTLQRCPWNWETQIIFCDQVTCISQTGQESIMLREILLAKLQVKSVQFNDPDLAKMHCTLMWALENNRSLTMMITYTKTTTNV